MPPETSSGPPPSADVIALQSGVSVSRTSTLRPTGASVVRSAACAPRATSTAPPAGIGVAPAVVTSVTVAVSGRFACVAGNDEKTASTTPLSRGVAAP